MNFILEMLDLFYANKRLYERYKKHGIHKDDKLEKVVIHK